MVLVISLMYLMKYCNYTLIELTLLSTLSSLKILYFFTSYFNIFLDSTSSSSKASNNYVPSDSTTTSSNETESIISIDDEENELPESKEVHSSLIYEIQK